jgi:hypothetical protein
VDFLARRRDRRGCDVLLRMYCLSLTISLCGLSLPIPPSLVPPIGLILSFSVGITGNWFYFGRPAALCRQRNESGKKAARTASAAHAGQTHRTPSPPPPHATSFPPLFTLLVVAAYSIAFVVLLPRFSISSRPATDFRRCRGAAEE